MSSNLQALLTAAPFRPFVLYTTDGGKIAVPSRDSAMLANNGVRLIVTEADGREHVVNVTSLTRAKVLPVANPAAAVDLLETRPS